MLSKLEKTLIKRMMQINRDNECIRRQRDIYEERAMLASAENAELTQQLAAQADEIAEMAETLRAADKDDKCDVAVIVHTSEGFKLTSTIE